MIGMDASTGRAISGIDHLVQSMTDILTTPIGTRVMRRDYGSMVLELVDYPLTGPNILRLYAATAHALMTWEPRVRITGVQFQMAMDGSAILNLDGIANGRDLQLSIPVRSA